MGTTYHPLELESEKAEYKESGPDQGAQRQAHPEQAALVPVDPALEAPTCQGYGQNHFYNFNRRLFLRTYRILFNLRDGRLGRGIPGDSREHPTCEDTISSGWFGITFFYIPLRAIF